MAGFFFGRSPCAGRAPQTPLFSSVKVVCVSEKISPHTHPNNLNGGLHGLHTPHRAIKIKARTLDTVMTVSYNCHNSFVREFMAGRLMFQVRTDAELRDSVIEAAIGEGLTVSSWIRHTLVKAVQESKDARQRAEAAADYAERVARGEGAPL